MRLKRTRGGGTPSVGATRAFAARTVAFACMAGLALTFAWPVLAVGQDEPPTLPGVYAVSIVESDLPPGLPGAAALTGQWTVTFNEDGTYAVARQDVGVIVSGAYAVDGATLTFTDWDGLLGCATPVQTAGAGEPAAMYAWTIDEGQIELTPIQESCPERRVLLSTRPLGTYEQCAIPPLGELAAPDRPAGQPSPAATPVGGDFGLLTDEAFAAATPVVPKEQVALDATNATVAVDALLRQATGCWATGEPLRFLPLHSQEVLAGLSQVPAFISELGRFMSTPVSFERVGDVRMIDPTHAWAYVEITFGGESIPQRIDFVLENGVWLMDSFFLFGPTDPNAPPTGPNPTVSAP